MYCNPNNFNLYYQLYYFFSPESISIPDSSKKSFSSKDKGCCAFIFLVRASSSFFRIFLSIVFPISVQPIPPCNHIFKIPLCSGGILQSCKGFCPQLSFEFLTLWFFLIVPKGIFIFFIIDYVIGIIRFIFIFIVGTFFIKTVPLIIIIATAIWH